jgi:hypothetical protein
MRLFEQEEEDIVGESRVLCHFQVSRKEEKDL